MKILFLSLLVLAATAATPAPAVDPVRAVLLSSSDSDRLRLDLAALARTGARPREAALALYYRATSFDRAAAIDSAIANYRASMAAWPMLEARDALVDALLRRHSAQDLQDAITMLEAAGTESNGARGVQQADPARLAWAYALQGDGRRALELIKPSEMQLQDTPRWMFRIGLIRYMSGDSHGAAIYLSELAVASRGYDEDVMRTLIAIDKELSGENVRKRVDDQLAERERQESALLRRMKGRSLRFAASDGATVGGYLFADSASKRPSRAVVVLRDLGDDIADYDSLVVGLRAQKLAVLIVDPRGSGWSVDSRVPLPDTWEGREQPLEARVARDVRDALGVFARLARIDTTRIVTAGIGAMAPVALQATDGDRRIVGVAMIDPWFSPVEQGPLLARARHTGVPGFVQLGVADGLDRAYADSLSASFARGVRRADAGSLGRGAGQFGRRPGLTGGFVRWVAEVQLAPPPKRASR